MVVRVRGEPYILSPAGKQGKMYASACLTFILAFSLVVVLPTVRWVFLPQSGLSGSSFTDMPRSDMISHPLGSKPMSSVKALSHLSSPRLEFFKKHLKYFIGKTF